MAKRRSTKRPAPFTKYVSSGSSGPYKTSGVNYPTPDPRKENYSVGEIMSDARAVWNPGKVGR